MRSDSGNNLLKRADALLASAGNRNCQSRLPHPR
jgi:hypothetical protein